MSRIGNQPITVPSNVDVKVAGKEVAVKGPKGELKLWVRREIDVELENRTLRVRNNRPERDRNARAYHGLTRALLNNMVVGVTQGYQKKLEITGVGYGVKQTGASLTFTLGYANEIVLPIPKGLEVKCASATAIEITGADKQMVGEFAARIRKLRPPEPYKGKGVKYEGEVIRRKAGKAFGS
ncbi:MAG: 50S ribosomal protein L6 [Planctomycetes bacterium]|nr:50S ribosomal protein L6 [Planctomycetota bacterium]